MHINMATCMLGKLKNNIQYLQTLNDLWQRKLIKILHHFSYTVPSLHWIPEEKEEKFVQEMVNLSYMKQLGIFKEAWGAWSIQLWLLSRIWEVLLHIFLKIPDSLCTYILQGFDTSLVASDNLDVTRHFYFLHENTIQACRVKDFSESHKYQYVLCCCYSSLNRLCVHLIMINCFVY